MTPQVLEPPPRMIAVTDEAWRRWFDRLYQVVGQGGQGTFPKLQIGKASFTNENAFQELLDVNQGIYVNYASGVNQIIYGFAANVYRAAGSAFVVGAQINAYASRGSTGGVFGLATTAVSEIGANVGITGYENNTANLEPANTKVKWGIYNVFKNRGDTETVVKAGLGADQYNLYAAAFLLESQVRSSTGEKCGWTVGIDFHDFWCDIQTIPAWSSTTTYSAGLLVSSGGKFWKAIGTSTNQTPAPASTYWVQHSYDATDNKAVGIDFSSMGTTAMGRMASAIRLRSTQYFHWEETGAVGTKFDAATGLHYLSVNQGATRFAIDVSTGDPHLGSALIALGGGAAPTLGTIGATGPAVAAQNGWLKLFDSGGVAFWVPAWK